MLARNRLADKRFYVRDISQLGYMTLPMKHEPLLSLGQDVEITDRRVMRAVIALGAVAGMAWLLSALGVFVQDLTQLIAFFIQVMMYASAVFYPVSRLPAASLAVLRFNPLLQAIDLARGPALWHQSVNFKHLGYLYVAGFAVCILGHWLFRRLKPAFADVL